MSEVKTYTESEAQRFFAVRFHGKVWAFAYECVARASAVAGNRDEALKYVTLAQQASEAIKEEQDQKIFMAEFNGGNWNQMR